MHSRYIFPLTFCLMTLVIVQSATAQDSYSMKSSNASIEGSSSLHDWKSEITNIQCKGVFDVQNGILKSVKSTEIKILVEGIKSAHGKIMNNKTYDAFKYKKNPYITYTFISGQVNNSANISTIDAIGTLSMAGQVRKVTLVTKITVLPNGDLQIIATEKIKMPDYQMKPPTAVLGTITVGDEVTVNFDLVLTPHIAQAKSK